MAKTTRKAGKRATAAGRGGLRARKSGVAKTRKPGSRKITKSGPGKRKPSRPSETAGLKGQLKTARMQQQATSEILRVISQSPTDVQPVFDAIVLTAARLFRCDRAFIQRSDGNHFWTVTSAGPEGSLPITQFRKAPIDPAANFPSRAILAKKTLHLPDWSAIDLPEFERGIREVHGTNAALYMPLLREGECIGLLCIIGKQAGMFGESEIALAESFRDQALIAIENARLFNETKEALERQTATADILKVIAGSPSEVQPVFDAIAASANTLLGGLSTAVHILDDDTLHMMAFTPTTPEGDASLQASYPRPLSALAWGAQLRNGEIVQVGDTDVEWSALPAFQDVARMRGFRSILRVPMLRDGATIGVIDVTRKEPSQFGAHHIQLLQTFADQAVIAIENTRLFNETREALERQTATAEVLQVINASPGVLAPVFDAIVDKAARLCDADGGALWLVDGGMARATGSRGGNMPEPFYEYIAHKSIPVEYLWGRNAQDRPFIHTADLKATKSFQDGVPFFVANVELGRVRTVLTVPLKESGTIVGVFTLIRWEVRPFTDKQIALVQSFAAQAQIAMKNANLINETREALEQQTATADILKVIASSPSDVQPVFEAIAERSKRLVEGLSSAVHRAIDDAMHLAAFTRISPEADAILKATFPRPLSSQSWGENIRNGETVHISDSEVEWAGQPALLEMARTRGFRSLLFVPLRRDRVTIGMISVTRKEPGKFAARHVQLLQIFADQAVIAIENVRLFNETREALERQTATADILKVIASSPSDVQPVFEAIAERSKRLVDALSTTVFRLEDGVMHLKAFTSVSPEADATLKAMFPAPLSNFSWGDAIGKSEIYRVVDTEQEIEGMRELARQRGFRGMLFVPLLREGAPIGVIAVTRVQPGPFVEHHVDLLRTFADQAVIAIENVRLFDEVQARTRDLAESLQFQTASSDVLKVISRSPDALQPVLDVIVETSRELCSSDASTIFLLRDGKFHVTALSGTLPTHLEFMRANPMSVDQQGSTLSRLAREKRTLSLANVADDPELNQGITGRGGPRALLSVPLMRNDQVIGAIVLRQSHLRPFTPRQIQAVEMFAEQAVIAISNVNLFEQVQQRTRELSQSLDDLRTAQDRLVQTEKLASLGQLTAGIAHEIKNPLNFVNNFSALSAELVDELNQALGPAALDDKTREEIGELTRMLKGNLEKVVQHGRRADSIVKNMLLHSREGAGEQRPADINALLDESLNLAYHGARAEKPGFNITLQREFDASAGMIELFPQEITRAFLNLISNGFYAATKRKSENGGSEFEPVLSAATKSLGDLVEIRIRDNGTGIPAEVREKMFNPFFTTKPAGEGTGLGLSMSHDIIVKQHGGRIDVETEPGQFTEFRIVLPRTSRK